MRYLSNAAMLLLAVIPSVALAGSGAAGTESGPCRSGGGCDLGLMCIRGRCVAPARGGLNQTCRSTAPACNTNLSCVSSKCVPQGWNGQPCLAGSRCAPGFYCSSSTAGPVCAPYGTIGQACNQASAPPCSPSLTCGFDHKCRALPGPGDYCGGTAAEGWRQLPCPDGYSCNSMTKHCSIPAANDQGCGTRHSDCQSAYCSPRAGGCNNQNVCGTCRPPPTESNCGTLTCNPGTTCVVIDFIYLCAGTCDTDAQCGSAEHGCVPQPRYPGPGTAKTCSVEALAKCTPPDSTGTSTLPCPAGQSCVNFFCHN